MNNTINTNNSYNAAYQPHINPSPQLNQRSVSTVKPVFTSTQKPKEDVLELSRSYKEYASAAQKSNVAVLNLNKTETVETEKTTTLGGFSIKDTLNFSRPLINDNTTDIVTLKDDSFKPLTAYQKKGISVYMKNAGYFSEIINTNDLVNKA